MARLVSACVLSRLECCNAILTGLPSSTLAPLQRVQNAAARLVLDLKPWSSNVGISSAPLAAESWIQAMPAHPPGSDRKVAGLSHGTPDNGQVTWFNVTIGRQRRYVYPTDKTEARWTSVLRLCSTSVESLNRLPTESRCISNTEQFKWHLKMFLFKLSLTDRWYFKAILILKRLL